MVENNVKVGRNYPNFIEEELKLPRVSLRLATQATALAESLCTIKSPLKFLTMHQRTFNIVNTSASLESQVALTIMKYASNSYKPLLSSHCTIDIEFKHIEKKGRPNNRFLYPPHTSYPINSDVIKTKIEKLLNQSPVSDPHSNQSNQL